MSPLRRSAFLSSSKIMMGCATVGIALLAQPGFAAKDLGNGFADLGVAAPISNHRGIVTTVDGAGRNVALAWIMDSRGCYALLMVDAETGKSEQFPIPFKNQKLDSPFASLLSSQNKFYTHFGDNFVEFDPVKRAFTFSAKTSVQMAMGMTEDDQGVIWAALYPNSAVVAFDPKTRVLRDFSKVYDQNWPQYQRFMAADDAGWIYFAVGMTATQIVALDPTTSESKPMLAEAERNQGGTAHVYRNVDGKVYGQAQHAPGKDWYELYKGEIRKIGADHKKNPKPIVTDSQVLFDQIFPDGSKLEEFNLVDRQIKVTNSKTFETKTLPIDYTSEGAVVMSLAAAPDGTISGGTAFPMRAFSYNPKSDEMIDRPAYGQWNTVTVLKDKFFVGGYPSGYMLEWEPLKPWVNTDKSNAETNPKFLTQITPVVHRPHSLVAVADGSAVVMGGTPQYGYTGGGLLIWDRKTSSPTVIEDKDLIPDQSTRALVELPDGKLLGGTTIEAGTGGEKKSILAELYIFDLTTKKLISHSAPIAGVKDYNGFGQGPDGLIYGFANGTIFFVYDSTTGKIVKQENVDAKMGGCITPQGPRIFIRAGQRMFTLMKKGIAELDEKTQTLRLVAEFPLGIEGGGDYFDGRIYFSKHSRIYSWEVPAE